MSARLIVGALAGVHLVWCFAALGVAALVPVVYSMVIYKSLAKQGRV